MGEKSRKPRRGSLFPFFFFKKKKKRDRRKFVSDSNRKGGREVSLLFTIRDRNLIVPAFDATTPRHLKLQRC